MEPRTNHVESWINRMEAWKKPFEIIDKPYEIIDKPFEIIDKPIEIIDKPYEINFESEIIWLSMDINPEGEMQGPISLPLAANPAKHMKL
jgi:hypothetical protein